MTDAGEKQEAGVKGPSWASSRDGLAENAERLAERLTPVKWVAKEVDSFCPEPYIVLFKGEAIDQQKSLPIRACG